MNMRPEIVQAWNAPLERPGLGTDQSPNRVPMLRMRGAIPLLRPTCSVRSVLFTGIIL
jgi:hypothetical protein